MRVAIVGSGISGLTAARELHREHEITLFESEPRLGGHAHTVTVEDAGVSQHLDTGFLVFNRRDYPRFEAILDELGVGSKPSDMSFSVRCSRTGVEYNGSSPGSIFCQPANAIRPGFWRMLRDVFRFYRDGRATVAGMSEDATVDDLVRAARYSEEFVSWHLLPLGSALWSAPPSAFRHYPVHFVVDFFDRHDLLELNIRRRVGWRTVANGSASYVERLADAFRDRIRLGDPVRSIRRTSDGVRVLTTGGEATVDEVILACHGDDALSLLEDPTPAEREILGAVRYQTNEVVLHTDTSLLPRTRKAWASWNYHVRPDRDLATVTYDLNRLQGLRSTTRYCVTLNETESVDPSRIIRRFSYSHPQYSLDWVRLRKQRDRIQGVHKAWFCGAYFGNGFHEDGVRSAAEVVDAIAHRALVARAS
ncbi:MAG: NAD(P)-binding protein [Candidatus Eisenbacteria bacterium]|uniref:NAD(P)-binding protein n=1 Tax=Eiseniibacteriota bacterium TaxID=2212470 RepID=A0A849SIG5_UNCEI|nr:NAD(P)-binding protein [Candidatus Eisenbacteria bacterium]